jgi:hypothetical protein
MTKTFRRYELMEGAGGNEVMMMDNVKAVAAVRQQRPMAAAMKGRWNAKEKNVGFGRC